MNAWIVSETPALAARLTEILGQLGVACATRTIAEFDSLQATPRQSSPQIVLVAVNRLFPPHLELVRRIRAVVDGTLAVFSTIPNHAAVLQAIRAGADDFVDLAGDVHGEMHSLIGRLRDDRTGHGPQKRLITVLPSYDPGDANLLAANVAVVLAQRCGHCVLLDCYLRGGDLAQLLSLSPRHTLADLLAQKSEVDQTMFDQAVTGHASGVQLLAGPRLFSTCDEGNLHAMQRILSLARGAAPVVVVNAPDPVQAEQFQALRGSDCVALTTRLDLVSLSRAKQHVAFMLDRGVPLPLIRVVAMGTGRRAEIPAKDIQKVLGGVAVECVPDDALAQMMSINVGEPLVLHAPKSEASRALRRVAASLMDDAAPAPEPKSALFSLPLRRAAPASPAAAIAPARR